jgi:hypothetical protein
MSEYVAWAAQQAYIPWVRYPRTLQSEEAQS